MLIKVLILVILFWPAPKANAEFFTGNGLLSLLQSNNTADKIQAIGYIQGVFDAHSNATICAPANVTAGQINDMIKNYLENNPAIRNRTADVIIRDALKGIWPCANRNPGRGV